MKKYKVFIYDDESGCNSPAILTQELQTVSSSMRCSVM